MPTRVRAPVNPLALTWVREAIGMPVPVAASKMGVSEDRLRQFEEGELAPTVKQLRTIGRVYKRPAAFFYLQELPEPPEPIRDFRSLPEGHDPELPALLDAVHAARERRLIAIDLSNLLGESIPDFALTATVRDRPADVAESIRQWLGVDLETQRSWKEPYTVLRNWIGAIEGRGVLVTQFSGVDVKAARGFSISDRPLPVIAINGKDSPRAKVFTVFHELCHVALSSSGLCDLHNDNSETIEPYCNQVAAEALVPAGVLLSDPLVMSHETGEWEDWRVRELASSFGVSNEVILRRLLALDRATPEFYEAKRAEYLAAYASAGEGGGFLPHFRRVLRDNGAALTGLVLQAYRSELVTPTDVSRYLGGVKLRHVSAMEEALGRTS